MGFASPGSMGRQSQSENMAGRARSIPGEVETESCKQQTLTGYECQQLIGIQAIGYRSLRCSTITSASELFSEVISTPQESVL